MGAFGVLAVLEPKVDGVDAGVVVSPLGFFVVDELSPVPVCDPVDEVVIPLVLELVGFVVWLGSVDKEDDKVVSSWSTVVSGPVEVCLLVAVVDSDIVYDTVFVVESVVVIGSKFVVGCSVVVKASQDWSSYQLGLRS